MKPEPRTVVVGACYSQGRPYETIVPRPLQQDDRRRMCRSGTIPRDRPCSRPSGLRARCLRDSTQCRFELGSAWLTPRAAAFLETDEERAAQIEADVLYQNQISKNATLEAAAELNLKLAELELEISRAASSYKRRNRSSRIRAIFPVSDRGIAAEKR